MFPLAMKSLPKRLLAIALCLLLLPFAFCLSAVASVGYSASESLRSAGTPVDCVPFSSVTLDDIERNAWIGINSASQLILLSKYVNEKESVDIPAATWRSQKYRLTNCITFTAEESTQFEPIASAFSKFASSSYSVKAFEGTFDGCGFVIDGLDCKTTKGSATFTKTISYTSLFGLVGANAKICNLVIGRNCTFTAAEELDHSCVASVASRVMAGAELTNLLNFAPVSGGVYAGGLVGRIDTNNVLNKVTMRNCTNLGAVSARTYAGGLIGNIQGSTDVSHSTNGGNITGTYAGGMFGAGQGAAFDVPEVKIQLEDLIQKGSSITGSTAAGNFFGKLADPEKLSLTNVTDCSYRSSALSFAGEANEVDLPLGATIMVWVEEEDEVLAPRFHGLQLGTYENQKLNLRFVGSIAQDLDSYSEIGYLISYGNGDAKRCSCRQVFTSLLAGSGAGMIPYTAEQLRGENGYLYALTLTGVPLREGNTVTFTVQSYARKTDGTELLGNSGTVDITVTDGVCSAEWRS